MIKYTVWMADFCVQTVAVVKHITELKVACQNQFCAILILLCTYIMFIYEIQADCTTLSVCITLQQEKAVAPIQAKKPNIKNTATDHSRKLGKNVKKNQNKEKIMVGKSYSSLTMSVCYWGYKLCENVVRLDVRDVYRRKSSANSCRSQKHVTETQYINIFILCQLKTCNPVCTNSVK